MLHKLLRRTILSSYTASCAQSYSETLEIHVTFLFDTRHFCTLL